MNFSELARVRSEVRERTVNHAAALLHFRNGVDGSYFKTDGHAQGGDPGDGQLHGITTTFTCLESLREAGEAGRDEVATALTGFVQRALDSPEQWQSEGAAKVYCRVRGLAPLVNLYPNLSCERLEVAGQLLNEAWTPVNLQPGSDAIFEVDIAGQGSDRYPPNAYLTYYGLVALERLQTWVENADDKRYIALAWMEKSLATQVALHFHSSPSADPQQLAWAICGLIRFREQVLLDRAPPTVEVVEAGLKAFFAQQQGGMWSRGEPLFHYPQAGNAYCYVFETLAELVHLAIDGSPRSSIFRRMLRPYAANFVASFNYLDATSRPLLGNLDGWCSGHHPHRTSPESWATACVYRFLQGMRRLFGTWTRDEAARLLGARQARGDLDTFATVGDTWDAGFGTAGSEITTSFVHPIAVTKSQMPTYDPDSSFIGSSDVRSAILFGPPGTGKTTLVEAVAACLGWQFVEITPAIFLERGVELVSARADEVFRQIMELDQCVVLFDEIDELIRNRGANSDPLERFFTTTMLPRLAKLWSQRKLLFFVNTNVISELDPAIRRSSRFDAAIFVLPPSFESKCATLSAGGVTVAIDKERVANVLDGKEAAVPESQHAMGWFGLVRFDQLGRLAARLRSQAPDPSQIGIDDWVAVLNEFGHELMSADWRDPEKSVADMTRAVVFQRYRDLKAEQRFDHGRRRVVEVPAQLDPVDGSSVLRDPDGEAAGYWEISAPDPNLQSWAAGYQLKLDSAGRLMQV
jgi:ATPase family associated with various cellular activities (AAA)